LHHGRGRRYQRRLPHRLMRIYERDLDRKELMRRVGNLAQIGGIDVVAYEEGHARGTRALQVNTGGGLRFSVHPERGLDVGRAEYAGIGLCYLAPNTARLVTIGLPQTIATDQYGFTQRLTERYGTHGRVAVTPATRFTHGERWDGDRCVLWIEGLIREEIAYGENLSLRRRFETEHGSRAFRIV